MTPPQPQQVTHLRSVPAPRAPDDLRSVLTHVPDDFSAAVTDVVVAGERLLGTELGIAVETDGQWSPVAGVQPAEPDAVEIRAGGVAVRWPANVPVTAEQGALLRQAGAWLALSHQRESAGAAGREATAETAVIRDVVGRLLSVRDVDQVLLSVANHTLGLLDADICGVMLREGDEVCMRSCVGNRVIDTARLRMHRGQGVAGLVFLTGEPAKVDNYLQDQTISQDFMSLAEQEETQSALAVPLRLQGEFIGVLEVWRRRPSLFTDRDVRRMVTLADIATVAIDNARLIDRQVAAAEQMTQARDALEAQVAVFARSASLQQALLRTVLDGVGLHAIARTVAVELGCQVGVYGPDGHAIAVHGGQSLAVDLPQTLVPAARPGRVAVPGTDLNAWTQPVHADGDQFGCVCLIPSGHTAEMMDIAAAQTAMACSLTLLRERAASRARTEELEQVLWDLLQGSVEHRIAARTRAKQLNVSLRGRLRVLYGHLENVDELAARHGWDTSQTDRVRRDALRTVRCAERAPGLTLASLRGNHIAGIVADVPVAGVKDLVNGLTTAVHRELPELRMTWGISRAHEDVVELPSAHNEARTALSAAQRLGSGNTFLYEELGIVRLLLCSGDDPDLQTFIGEVTGPLVAYDRDNDGALVRTLRAFFDADCTQRLAAERLFIHHKTLRYRLEQIKNLTGLDLSRHEDRMRADFALRLLQLNNPVTEDDEPA